MFYYNNSMEKNGEAFLRSVATGLVHKHTSTVTQGRRNLLKVGGGGGGGAGFPIKKGI
jgi:hypothetical protein